MPDYWEATGLLLRGKVAGFTMPGHGVLREFIVASMSRSNGTVCGSRVLSISEAAHPWETAQPSLVPRYGSGCVIQPGALLRERIPADYTRISSVAALEQKLTSAASASIRSGKSLEIEESQIRWLVDDARNKEDLSESELLLFEEVKNLPVS